MRSLRLRWRLLTLLAVFALVVAACSSGDDAADETTTTAAATETTEAAATETTAAATETTAATTETTEAMAEAAGGQLAGMTVVDDNTFTVELATADPEFPLQMAYAAYYAMPEVAFEDPAAFEEAPIGNGPFMMDGVWEHDVSIPMKAFDAIRVQISRRSTRSSSCSSPTRRRPTTRPWREISTS